MIKKLGSAKIYLYGLLLEVKFYGVVASVSKVDPEFLRHLSYPISEGSARVYTLSNLVHRPQAPFASKPAAYDIAIRGPYGSRVINQEG